MSIAPHSTTPGHTRVRAALYAALSLVTLVALTKTGWARLGPLGFGLTLSALFAARLLNRPWLYAGWRRPGKLSALARDLGGQAALALCLFWLGFGLSHLTNWSPDFGVGRPAAVILVVGGLRCWLFPPHLRGAAARPAPPDLGRALESLSSEAVSRHQLQELLALCRKEMPVDRFALQLIDRAETSARASDRLAMVLGVTTPEQALASAGHRDLARAFDVLRDGRDGEALLTFAVRAAALLESFPDTLCDLPAVERLRQVAEATQSPAAAAGLRGLASLIEQQKNKMYSL